MKYINYYSEDYNNYKLKEKIIYIINKLPINSNEYSIYLSNILKNSIIDESLRLYEHINNYIKNNKKNCDIKKISMELIVKNITYHNITKNINITLNNSLKSIFNHKKLLNYLDLSTKNLFKFQFVLKKLKTIKFDYIEQEKYKCSIKENSCNTNNNNNNNVIENKANFKELNNEKENYEFLLNKFKEDNKKNLYSKCGSKLEFSDKGTNINILN